MLITIKTPLLSLTMLMLAACGSTPKGEAEHYNEMRNGTIYKTYQKVSIEALKPVVQEYNKKLAQDNKAETGNTQVHALLGLIWVAASQPKYALAETEYAIEHASDPRDQYAALTIQAVAMHEQGWNFLAKQNSTQAKALVQTHGLSNSYHNTLALVHVAGSALALKEGNIPYVAKEVRELGVVSKQDWIIELGDATDEVYSGAHAKAIARLAKLKNDPQRSEQERAGIAKVMAAIQAGGKDVATEAAKSVVSLAFHIGIQNSSLTPQLLAALPEKYREKFEAHLNNATH